MMSKNGATSVIGRTFNEILTDPTKDVSVEFYNTFKFVVMYAFDSLI
jgi:hypothetical protein